MKNVNPFLYGHYLKPKYFCDRKIETTNIIQLLNKNKNIHLIGRNGIGKTSLIKHVFHQLNKDEDHILIFIDVLKITSISAFIEELFISTIKENAKTSIKRSSKLKKIVLTHSVNEDGLPQKTEDFFCFLNSLKKKVVIAVDNCHIASQFSLAIFDELFIPNATTSSNISLILASPRKILSNDLFDIVELKKIPSEEYRKFITKQFSSIGFSISEKGIKRIFEFSNGETSSIQLICSKIVENNEKKIKSKIVDDIITSIILEYSSNFEIIKYLLSPYQWKLIVAIATEKEAVFVTSNYFIEKYKLNAPSSVKTALDSLLEKELILRSENAYSVTNSILRHWLVK